MEIEEKMYAPNGDIPKNLEHSYTNQYGPEKEEKIKNVSKNRAYNELLDRITKSTKYIKEPSSKYSDSIILRSSYDKTKRSSEQNSTLYKTNSINYVPDINDISENLKESNKNDNNINTNNNDNRKKVMYVNNIYQEKIRYSNSSNVLDNNDNDNNMAQNEKENKILSNFNAFDSLNFSNNNNINNNGQQYKIDENNRNTNYYSPFLQNNYIKDHSKLKCSETFNTNQIKNNSFTLPNITLKALNKNKNDEKIGPSSGFFSIFSKNKKKSNNNSEEVNKPNNDLETIEQKIQSEPYFNSNQLIILSEEKKDKEKNNFTLSSIPTKKGKLNYNDIDKLKNDLIYNKEKDNSQGANIDQNNKEFEVNENIYGNENGNNNYELKCTAKKEEQTENDMDYNPDDEDEDNLLGNSSEVIDIDKYSEYTLQTGTNIDYLVKKKRNISPLLIAVLLGGAGLIYLIYRSKKVRDMILNILKVFNIVPELLKGFLCIYGGEIEDFLERYDDMFRLLGYFISIIFAWVIFKLLMKFVAKIWKRKK